MSILRRDCTAVLMTFLKTKTDMFRRIFFSLCLSVLAAVFLFSGIPAAADSLPWNTAETAYLKEKKQIQEKERPVYNGVKGGAWILVRFYQKIISPQDGPKCRFHPVCSAYGREAVEKYGALLGAFLAGDRLLRCNYHNSPGKDPVPESLCDE